MKLINLIILTCFSALVTSCSHYSTNAKIETLFNKYMFAIQTEEENVTTALHYLSDVEKNVYLDSLKIIRDSIECFDDVNKFIRQQSKIHSIKDSNFIIVTILFKHTNYIDKQSYGVFAIVMDSIDGDLFYKSSSGQSLNVKLTAQQLLIIYQSIKCNHFYLERYYRECGTDILVFYQNDDFNIINAYLYTCLLMEDGFEYSQDFLCVARLRRLLFDDIIYNNFKRK